MAFYLDEIIEKYEGAAFMCQYGRYLNMVAVALVEYAYENLKFKKGSATYWQAIQEAERILGNYIDEYWDYYFSFLDKKEKTFLICNLRLERMQRTLSATISGIKIWQRMY